MANDDIEINEKEAIFFVADEDVPSPLGME